MSHSVTRRDFLTHTAQAGAAAGLIDLAFLDQFPAHAADKETPRLVPLSADLEPLVRLIEDTPRNKLIESVARQVRAGTSYQQLLGAVLLAGVRGIQPRPVGFKFHAVLVIHSAHLASLAATDNDRWLPLFWALDNFKNSQAANKTQGDWHMAPVHEAKLPSATQARKRFVDAMDSWDEEGADVAVAALARTAGASEICELFWRYGARDFRDIGHKAIYVANATRTLNTIGWRHAEPVLRSMAYALLEHEGDNPAKREDEKDVIGRENLKRTRQIRQGWTQGKVSAPATTELLAVLRKATPDEASEEVVTLLNKEIAPASIWDALFLGAGELLMRQPGIVGLHCVTSANALRYAFDTSGDEQTRQLMMLQAAAFLTMFRKRMESGKLAELAIDRIEQAELKPEGTAALGEIFRDVSSDRLTAARKTLTLLERKPSALDPLMKEARRLIFAKGNDSHDYKFSSAALEDAYHVTPTWRNRYLASSLFHLRGSGMKDTDLLRRTRAALEAQG